MSYLTAKINAAVSSVWVTDGVNQYFKVTTDVWTCNGMEEKEHDFDSIDDVIAFVEGGVDSGRDSDENICDISMILVDPATETLIGIITIW